MQKLINCNALTARQAWVCLHDASRPRQWNHPRRCVSALSTFCPTCTCASPCDYCTSQTVQHCTAQWAVTRHSHNTF